MKATMILSLALMLVIGVSAAQAQPAIAKNEHRRIDNTVRSGEFKRGEANKIRAEKKAIRKNHVKSEKKHMKHNRKNAHKRNHHKHNGRVRHK